MCLMVSMKARSRSMASWWTWLESVRVPFRYGSPAKGTTSACVNSCYEGKCEWASPATWMTRSQSQTSSCESSGSASCQVVRNGFTDASTETTHHRCSKTSATAAFRAVSSAPHLLPRAWRHGQVPCNPSRPGGRWLTGQASSLAVTPRLVTGRGRKLDNGRGEFSKAVREALLDAIDAYMKRQRSILTNPTEAP